MGLVADAMVLAKSGHAKTSGGLNVLLGLKSEEEYLVWSAISTHISSLVSAWWEQPQPVRDGLNAFRRYLFSPLVAKHGYDAKEGDSDDIKQLRALAITQAAAADDKKVIDELVARFKHFTETGDDSRIPADLQRPVYETVVRTGGREGYDAIKKIYNNPPTPHTKIAAMFGLTCSPDPAIIEETLKFSMSDEVKIQDVMYFFAGSAAHRTSRRAMSEFAIKNYDTILKRFENNFSLSGMIKFSFQRLSTEKDLQAVQEFFKDKDCSKFNLGLAQCFDEIRGNAAWIERAAPDVAQWLQKFQEENK
jgi:aminopeptidase 2